MNVCRRKRCRSAALVADPSETGVVSRLGSQHHCAGTSIANIIMLVARMIDNVVAPTRHVILLSLIRATSLPGSAPRAPGHTVARDHARLPSRDGRFVARARLGLILLLPLL